MSAEIRQEEQNQKTKSLVSWCFEPSQPLGIISDLNETFVSAEIRQEVQNQKTKSLVSWYFKTVRDYIRSQ